MYLPGDYFIVYDSIAAAKGILVLSDDGVSYVVLITNCSSKWTAEGIHIWSHGVANLYFSVMKHMHVNNQLDYRQETL